MFPYIFHFLMQLGLFSVSNSDQLTLTILHTNDIHSRLLEINSCSLSCSEQESEQGKCYGGFSRLNYKVGEIRESHPNVIYLSAGDYFQGTPWYTVYKWKALSHFVNQFGHTAMVLGNHEFEDGVEGLVPFLDHSTFPIISSNIGVSHEPTMTGKLRKSVIVEYENRKVGIIGYTLKSTPDLANVGKLEFHDEFSAVAKEAQKLNEAGIKIIIALGHSGYATDMKIATVPFVDVVVGGHSNTFLFTGNPLPDIEVPTGEYPTIIKSNGRNVPVVQAYAFGKYLGYLNVTFDAEGEVVSWAGNPILLDRSVPQDLKMEDELQGIGRNFLGKFKQVIGETGFLLDGLASCRMGECSFGDLLADSLVEATNSQNKSKHLPSTTMAILTGGMLRASIPTNRSITLEDLITAFPFLYDTISVIEVTGKHLRDILEFSITGYDQTGIHHTGKILQLSGIYVTFDLRRPKRQKVVSLSAVGYESGRQIQKLVNDSEVYRVALPDYISNGGDGYKEILKNPVNSHKSGYLVFDALTQYIRNNSPLSQRSGNRTTIICK